MSAFIAAAKALKKGQTSKEFNSETVTEVIKCPFDLDEIFKSDTERFGQLQEVIKFIFEQLNSNSARIESVDMKMASKFMEISQ
jgi:hypothetical protein